MANLDFRQSMVCKDLIFSSKSSFLETTGHAFGNFCRPACSAEISQLSYNLPQLEPMDGLCIFLGFSTQHTFISFFLWMSSMAMNITYKFSNIFKVLTLLTFHTKVILLRLVIMLKEESKDHGKTLVKITVFSQVIDGLLIS